MKLKLLLLTLLLAAQSCIPLRTAPSIADYKVSKGKKFKRELSKRQMFIFENPKKDGHFYDYVNTKFQLNHKDVYDDIPFSFEGESYFFAWYEVEIPDKSVNIAPALINEVMNRALDPDDEDEDSDYLNEPDVFRKGNWYLALEVYSDTENDCLHKDALSREDVLKYLRALKKEYLSTHNYHEIVFKN